MKNLTPSWTRITKKRGDNLKKVELNALAVRARDGSKETDFIPVIVWKGQAEACEKYLSKGRLVGFEGRLQIRNYEDNKGVKRTIAEIVASSVQFLSSKSDGNSSAYAAEELEEMTPLDDIPF